MKPFTPLRAALLLLLSVTVAFPARGQGRTGSISGKVISQEDGKPFEYANVVVSDTGGNMIHGSVTDATGSFMARNIPLGQPVSLEISFIGFTSYRLDSMVLTAEVPNYPAGEITLRTDAELLEEVVVSGQRAVVQASLDKKTYNVEKSSITKSKSVADVLAELPSVSVEADGTISLRGNSNVRILIDGERSLAQSGEIELILQQMPAESVEKIDLVTNPSAKYDPEGTAGIINIILKKEKNRGVNGTVSAGLGTFNKYNASTFVSYRKNKLGISANYNFRYYDSYSEETMDRTTTLGGEPTYLNQSDESDNKNMSHFARLGFSIAANERNDISISGLTSLFWFDRDGDVLSTQTDDEGNVTDEYLRNSLFNGHGRFTNANIYHTHKFRRDGANVKYGFNYSNFSGEFDGGYRADTFHQEEAFFESEQLTEVDAVSHTLDASIDATVPVNDKITLEAGYKSSVNWRVGDFYSRSRQNTEGPYLVDLDLLNDYTYNEQIHAVYANHIHSLGRFSYQVGLRLEQVRMDANTASLSQQIDFDRNYFAWYPSVYLRQQLGQDENAPHELQLSYSRRINRPSFRITNPFRDYSNPQNPREGNPFLQPEFINAFELGYNKVWPKVSLNSSLFYRLTTDLYTRINTLIDAENNIILTSYSNIGKEHEFGWEVVGKFKAFDWWELGADFNLAQNYIRGTEELSTFNNERFTYGGKATSTMTVWKGLEISLIGRYQGPRATAQGEREGYGTLDIALKQDVLKGKGTITLSANDVTNTVKRSGNSRGEGFYETYEDKNETRIFWLTFSYGFGKMGEMFNKRNNRRNGNGGDDDGEDGLF